MPLIRAKGAINPSPRSCAMTGQYHWMKWRHPYHRRPLTILCYSATQPPEATGIAPELFNLCKQWRLAPVVWLYALNVSPIVFARSNAPWQSRVQELRLSHGTLDCHASLAVTRRVMWFSMNKKQSNLWLAAYAFHPFIPACWRITGFSVFALSQRFGNTSSRPRNRLMKIRIFPSGLKRACEAACTFQGASCRSSVCNRCCNWSNSACSPNRTLR